METELGIRIPLVRLAESAADSEAKRCVVFIAGDDARELPAGAKSQVRSGDVIYRLEPRGIGATRWTTKNPPNYVARSHVLVGRTVDAGRVWDIAATAKYLHAKHGERVPIVLLGEKSPSVLAIYAALFAPEVSEVTAIAPPTSHMQATAPQFLNVLRVADIPDAAALLAPRSLTIITNEADSFSQTAKAYAAADAEQKLRLATPKRE